MKVTVHGTSDLDARLEFLKAERERNKKIVKFDEERRQRYEREEAEKKEKLKAQLEEMAATMAKVVSSQKAIEGRVNKIKSKTNNDDETNDETDDLCFVRYVARCFKYL